MRHLTTGTKLRSNIAIWLTVILSLIHKPGIGQVFPVQATINVTPPYTVYLSHYTAPDQQRVMATVLLRDPVVTSIDVFLRFTIEGPGIKIYTNPSWKPAPLNIQTGIPVLIPSSTIAECLRPQNIIVEGMSPQELYRGGKLPEGYYQFKVEVFEYNRGVPISNVGRTGVWLLLNEPPRIVFPANNQKVNATNPQFINFSWVPGGIASPLSAQNTMYEFTMVELLGDVDPNIAITTAPDALKFTRTLQQTSLLYGPGEPPLIPGKRYAFRVRAYNTEGYEIFKNNGYSEVRVFHFGDACLPPTLFTLKDETQNSFAIEVVADPGSTAWQARFREGGNESAQWSELKTETTNSKTVKGLKASTEYQVQLKSLCGTVSSDFTAPQAITTKQKVNTQRSCDNSVSPFVVQQAAPLKALKPKDIFLAAQVPIKVTEVTSQGNGKFTGKGVASLPLFNAGLAVTFTDISINEFMQLTAGNVVVERSDVNITLFGDNEPVPGGGNGGGSNPDSTGTSQWPEFTDTLTVDSDIDSVVVVNDSTVWVYTSGGTGPIVANLGGNDCLLIVPADGNMDKAQVVYNGAAKPYRVGSGSSTDSQEQFSGFRVRFTPALNSQYGFDSLRMDALENFYNDISIDGKLYKLPWKALAAGIPEPVEMHVRRGADSLDYSKLKVRILGGSTLTPTTGANTPLQTFNLTGTTPGDEYAVVAQYEKDKENAYAGGLWAATYQNKTFTLYVVPLPGVDFTQSVHGNLQNYLNRIYSQAVVSWNVQVIKGFTGIDLGENGLDHAENELLSAYNPEMNSVISAFKAWQGSINSQAAYLFLVPRADGGLQGYMPFNRQFGFVVAPTGSDGNVDAAALARTVAHELGHGIFSLRHTFSEKNFVTLPQGKTDNLMDYPSTGSGLATATDATKLDKYQWDLIHDPQRVWFSWLEEEGEGEIGIYGVTWLGNVLFGLYPDEQEREIETRLELFNHIYQEYENYYNNSKIKDIYLSVDKYKNWSVRKASFQGIAKKVFKGLKTNDNTFNLWNEGIYFEDYKLEGKSYKIAIYSARKNIVLGETIRIKSFSQLRYNKSIKAGYTKNYGLISFYDTEGKMNMVIQIIGESSKKDVTQWLNYLGLILPSREQEKEDKDIIDKILEVILHDINKLNEIWGEKKEDQEESAIEIALTEMEEFLGNSYAYGGGDSRTSLDEKGTDEMDCSEFVARFLQKACGLEEVPSPFYTSLMLSSMQDGSFDSFLQHVKNSEKEDFKDIRPGDVFLWSRSSSDGHTGVVVSYDKETDKVTVIEAIGISGAAEESLSKDIEGYCQGCIRKSIYTRTGKALYKHAGWKGYFRAVTTK